MAEILRPELCIVGAGALGIALAQHARRLGAQVVLVDRGFPEPGDAPQRALRLAALAASAATAKTMRHGSVFGLANTDPKTSIRAVQERARDVAAAHSPLDSHNRLKALGIEVVSGEAQFTDPATLLVGDIQVRPQAFLVAVGSLPAPLDIPGLDEIDVLTPDALIDNTRKLTHLLVLGNSPEALPLAQIYARLGSQVTVVPQGGALDGFDIEAASIVLQALAEDGVRVLDGANLRSIQPRAQGIGAVVAQADGAEQQLDLSHVLICSEDVPHTDGLGLDMARLRFLRGQAGRLLVGALGETSNRRVRVVGVSAGLADWQIALAHGRNVVEALVLGLPRRRPAALPRLIMTEPALAQIGRPLADAKKLAPGATILRANLAENDALRADRLPGGLVKVIADKRGRVTGASLAGSGVADLAGVLALAMDQGIALDALADLPLPNPSLMNVLVGLGENRMASRTVSSSGRYLGTLRRLSRL